MSSLSCPTTELLAPGGSLDQAVHALRAGADAVYCGLPRFSARSHARNPGPDELNRLCGEAAARGARVHLALNTLLADDELEPAVEQAWLAWEAGASAAIVQDLGLARALVRGGPPWELHASTQLSVHNAGGARAALALGFRRVVLARELSVAEVAAIIAAVPELDYECFIHGALCYGLSGACLASGLLLGRSGNRGDCGQVCRTWSVLDGVDAGPAAGTAGFWFSLNDLEAGPDILALRAAGVHSFKIEGRMKPPEWTAKVVAHYRALLDGTAAPDSRQMLDSARESFGRRPTRAWLADRRGAVLVNRDHPGSVGMTLGLVEAVAGDRLRVCLERPAAVKDGVQLLRPGTPGNPPETVRFAIVGIESAEAADTSRPARKPSRPLWSAPAGSVVWLRLGGAPLRPADTGLELAKVSDHAAGLPAIAPESLPRHRRRLKLRVRLLTGATTADATTFTLRLETDLPGTDTFTLDVPAALEPSPRPDGFAQAFAAQFEKAGSSWYSAGDIDFDPALSGRFLPPAQLKDLRQAWYAGLAAHLAERRGSLAAAAVRAALDLDGPEAHAATRVPALWLPPPLRSTLSPAGPLPFVAAWDGLAPDHLARWGRHLVVPLPPACFDEEAYLAAGRSWLAALPAGTPVVFGLNNLAHGGWPDRLDPEHRLERCCFTDYALWRASAAAEAALRYLAPDVAAVVHWIERPALEASGRLAATDSAATAQPAAGAAPLPRIGTADFHPPLFISRACFRRHSLGIACAAGHGFGPDSRPLPCPRRFTYTASQGKRRFRVEVVDCLSYTFED